MVEFFPVSGFHSGPKLRGKGNKLPHVLNSAIPQEWGQYSAQVLQIQGSGVTSIPHLTLATPTHPQSVEEEKQMRHVGS